MTRTATGQHRGALNVVFLDEPGAFFSLVIALRGPIHFEDLILRPDEHLRLPVTLKAPLHLKRGGLISEGHEINSAMTSRAPHALIYVNAVIEKDEVGQIVNPNPFDGLAAAPALADRLEVRAVRPNLGVAIHAGLGRGDTRKREFLNRGVTVAAVNAVVTDVVLMAELNRLFAREERLGVIRRSVELQQ